MGDPEKTAQTRAWLSLEALSDAVHYTRQRPLKELDRQQLDQLTTLLYLTAGLSPEEATLLYGESIDRHADRIQVVLEEVTT